MQRFESHINGQTVATDLRDFFDHQAIEALTPEVRERMEMELEDIHAATCEVAALRSEHRAAVDQWIADQGRVDFEYLAERLRRAIFETSTGGNKRCTLGTFIDEVAAITEIAIYTHVGSNTVLNFDEEDQEEWNEFAETELTESLLDLDGVVSFPTPGQARWQWLGGSNPRDQNRNTISHFVVWGTV